MTPKPAVSPVNSVSPMTPMLGVANTAEELNFRFEQLNLAQLSKGQQYQGRVMAKLDDQTFLVALNGGALKMSLAANTKVGEFIQLRYMGGFPPPTFMLSPPPPAQSAAKLSESGQMINQYLNMAEQKTTIPRHEATQPVTSSPFTAPAKLAQELRQALGQSGLFYESHLVAYSAGQRSLASLLQEPQNQPNTILNTLVPQQLQILEQQRLLWHGEIWPRQLMEWEIARHHDRQSATEEETSEQDERAVDSHITLHLPRLGEVTAKLSISQGRMRIDILADKPLTEAMLKQQGQALIESLQAAGLSLEHFAIKHHEPNVQP